MNNKSFTREETTTSSHFRPTLSGVLQRKCACGGSSGPSGGCEECRGEKLSLQRSPRTFNSEARSLGAVPPIVKEVLNSPGIPLNHSTRHFMEPRFGQDVNRVGDYSVPQASSNQLQVGPANDRYEHEADSVAERVMSGDESVSRADSGFDFSQVRIHTDERAAESARAVDALAYTVGRDVVFGAGQFSPGTNEGRRLIAHELTHVVQQGGGSSSPMHIQRAPASPKTSVRLATAGKCRDERLIAEAIPGARSMAEMAFNWFLSFSTFDRARIGRLLLANFRSDSDDVRGKVKDRIFGIKERLAEAQAGNITFVCAPATDTECQGRSGYVLTTERDRIHICDPFFDLTLEGRRWMLIHEHAHLAGAMVSPETYLTSFGPIDEQQCLQPTQIATTKEALENADSYAQFIWCLIRKPGIEVNPPATP